MRSYFFTLNNFAFTEILFTEDFEKPAVTVEQSTGITKNVMPDQFQNGTVGIYNSNSGGIINKDAGASKAPAGNQQALAFRYTAIFIAISKPGLIGKAMEGMTYTVSFDVQADQGDRSPTLANGYDAQLYIGDTIVAKKSGAVPHDTSFHKVSFSYRCSKSDVGKDIKVEFKDVWDGDKGLSAGVIDNIQVSRKATIVDDASNTSKVKPMIEPKIKSKNKESKADNIIIGFEGMNLIFE